MKTINELSIVTSNLTLFPKLCPHGCAGSKLNKRFNLYQGIVTVPVGVLMVADR